MCNRHAHTLTKGGDIRVNEDEIKIICFWHTKAVKKFPVPHSFPVYAIHAKAERLSTADFKWLKKSDRLPSVNAFAFIITSFNGLRNSANPARSGFCKTR